MSKGKGSGVLPACVSRSPGAGCSLSEGAVAGGGRSRADGAFCPVQKTLRLGGEQALGPGAGGAEHLRIAHRESVLSV